MEEGVFNEFADMALQGSGQHIPPSKAYLVEARLARIIRREGFSKPGELAACLKARPNKVLEAEITAALTSKKTRFFTNRDALKKLVHETLPARAEAGRTKLRIWCAGGATGQEAYSIAMLLAEDRPATLADVQIDIVSTDICDHAIKRARTGHYGHFEVQRGLSVHRMLDHFTRQEDGGWQLSDDLRASISFRQHNLLDDMSGLGEFDAIVCRDVLPHMVRSVREVVAGYLVGQILPGGLLVLGENETLPFVSDAFTPFEDMRHVLTKAGGKATAAAA